MASARLQAIGKTYPGGTVALRDFDLALHDGEFMVLVGPSGCGKSTALRILAGLEAPTSGQVWIDDRDVTDLPPGERDVAMVFQSYALYPHKTVRENIGFGLRMRAVPREQIEQRTREIADKLGLADLLERRPAQLSGGQRQRVALARALVRSPRLFLMDEPLSNLDAKLRMQTRAELGRLHLAFGVTTLYVTHDQEEAMTLGQRIAVLSSGGRIEQLGTPAQIYDTPASSFVADFIGTPSINWFPGELCARDGQPAIRTSAFELPAGSLSTRGGARELKVGVRPHDFELCDARTDAIAARVELVELLGASRLVHARSEREADIRVLLPADTQLKSGEQIGLRPASGKVHVFDADSGARLTADVG